MCIICRKEYDVNTKVIYCCDNIKKIPKTLINLKTLDCCKTQIKKIPETLINLRTLYCSHTQIKFIPKTLIKLKEIFGGSSNLIYLPEEFTKLDVLTCGGLVLISPRTYNKSPNNKRYLTFVRCQVRYKLKLRLNKLKFAYDPKYIIGHNAKKQLVRFFQN
jgi:hypothetical protein